MIAKAIQKIKDENGKKDIPDISVGDSVKVHVKIKEGEKERIQVFAGTVIAKKGSGISTIFTVRRIAAHGVGVERVFPVSSPAVSKVEIANSAKVRRAKLYYLRRLSGKKGRLKTNIK
jgi:large subunit ribosomal protein L19